ncbi:MAG: Gfo/Idh/MocA family oxidoreductase [Litorimonas sp.]
MSEPLKVGVVGAGVFAGYHAAKVAAHDRAILTSVYDVDPTRAAELADRLDTSVAVSLSSLIEGADALVIATPASVHEDAAITALRAGRHVLIEKPFATTRAGCEAILAAQDGLVVQVGHQERLVAEAVGLHRLPKRPREIEIVRHTPRTTRNLDTSVIMDLMIHDIDLLQGLYGDPDWISTEAARRIYSPHYDAVRAEMGFGEMTAYLSASRDADAERRWIMRFDSGTVAIDFAAKTLRNDTPHDLDADFGDQPDVRDNLAAAFDRFIRAVLDGERPLASGRDGSVAVETARTIEGKP